MTIREVRKSKGITQAVLAKACGFSQSIISQYEKGSRTPSIKDLKKIAQCLGVNSSDILPDPDIEPIPQLEIPENEVPRIFLDGDRLRKRLCQDAMRAYPDLIIVRYECKCKIFGNKERHHFDYTKPFDVLLLCPECHRDEHSRLRKLRNHTSSTPATLQHGSDCAFCEQVDEATAQ